MSSLPDFASFHKELALELNEMQPDLPPSEHDPICREFMSRADLVVAGAGEHVFELIAANRATERLTDYFIDLEGMLALLRRAA